MHMKGMKTSSNSRIQIQIQIQIQIKWTRTVIIIAIMKRRKTFLRPSWWSPLQFWLKRNLIHRVRYQILSIIDLDNRETWVRRWSLEDYYFTQGQSQDCRTIRVMNLNILTASHFIMLLDSFELLFNFYISFLIVVSKYSQWLHYDYYLLNQLPSAVAHRNLSNCQLPLAMFLVSSVFR